MSVCLFVCVVAYYLLDLQWNRQNIHLLCVFQEVLKDSVIPLKHIFCSFGNMRLTCLDLAAHRQRQFMNIFNSVCLFVFIKVSMPALQLLPHGSISMDSTVWREHTEPREGSRPNVL